MSKINHLRSVGRTYTGKAVAAYATYETVTHAAAMFQDRFSHVWAVDATYADAHYRAAMAFCSENAKSLPLQRLRVITGDSYDADAKWTSTSWTPVPMRGVALTVQARTVANTVEFRSLSKKDLKAIRELIGVMADEMEESDLDFDFDAEPVTHTSIYGWDGSNWTRTKSRVSRSFSSVLVPKEIQDDLENDLERFSNSRVRLERLEMPWRRGYMLSGPPGTGKTSLSLAIAGRLGFNLASLSLTDMKDDGMLRKAISSLPKHTVVVIEDIDAYAVSNDRDHNVARDGGLSLSGLLNALDGFETPDGLVTIMTTNHLDHLDDALVRNGRVDRSFHLGYIEAPELERLFSWFYEMDPLEPAPDLTHSAQITPAEVAEIFKQHLDDAVAGYVAARETIVKRATDKKVLENILGGVGI